LIFGGVATKFNGNLIFPSHSTLAIKGARFLDVTTLYVKADEAFKAISTFPM
jgi:hypothetical protein